MADESVVHSIVPGTAAVTHILAIGVGHYPHLPEGQGQPLADPQGLGQLTSPPASARAFATWTIEHWKNPERELASVRLLVSEQPRQTFRNPRTGQDLVPAPATIDNIEAAVSEWKAKGDENPDNLLVFYFCGHGLGNNPLLALLAEDFGSNPDNALDGAIDFGKFRSGMNRSKAQWQCYFVDACRNTADLLAYGEGVAGRPLLLPSALAPRKQQPTFYSTLVGAQAHGPQNKPSYFTESLIEALEGAGADKNLGHWGVSTTRLQEALLSRMTRKKRGQVPPADDVTKFYLHWLSGPPMVPVIVRCEPEDALLMMRLICVVDGNQLHCREPAAEPWELELQAGMYAFSAVRDGDEKARSEEYVLPPEQAVPLKVAP